MRAGMYQGADRDRIAVAQARTSDTLQAQPVIREIVRISVPTTFVIGTYDMTGASASSPTGTRAAPGSIPAMVDAAAARIKDAKVIRLEGVGHSPQVEPPAEFNRLLLGILAGSGDTCQSIGAPWATAGALTGI